MSRLDAFVRNVSFVSLYLSGYTEVRSQYMFTERDSPKSHFIVVCFLIIVSTLLFLAGLKHYGFDLSASYNRSGVKGVATVNSTVSLTLS